MIIVTKAEREYLLANGCKYPTDLHATLGRGRKGTTYATESYTVKKLLAAYRRKHIVRTYPAPTPKKRKAGK